MKLQLIHKESGEILFDGKQPNENVEAWKLATAQEVIAVYKPDTEEEISPKDRRPEAAYAALFIWFCIGLVAVGCAAGFALRMFALISGV